MDEASRCLRCNVATVFDSELCILCGGCVDVCPVDCLRIVDLAATVSGLPGGLPPSGSAILKDETSCTRCGLCVRRCPTQAITLEAFSLEDRVP